MGELTHLAAAVELLRIEGVPPGPEALSEVVDSLEFTLIVLRAEERVGTTWTQSDIDRLSDTPLEQLMS